MAEIEWLLFRVAQETSFKTGTPRLQQITSVCSMPLANYYLCHSNTWATSKSAADIKDYKSMSMQESNFAYLVRVFVITNKAGCFEH